MCQREYGVLVGAGPEYDLCLLAGDERWQVVARDAKYLVEVLAPPCLEVVCGASDGQTSDWCVYLNAHMNVILFIL
jgi:hypothetical protein